MRQGNQQALGLSHRTQSCSVLAPDFCLSSTWPLLMWRTVMCYRFPLSWGTYSPSWLSGLIRWKFAQTLIQIKTPGVSFLCRNTVLFFWTQQDCDKIFPTKTSSKEYPWQHTEPTIQHLESCMLSASQGCFKTWVMNGDEQGKGRWNLITIRKILLKINLFLFFIVYIYVYIITYICNKLPKARRTMKQSGII